MPGSLAFASASDSVTVSLGAATITDAFTLLQVVRPYAITAHNHGTFGANAGDFGMDLDATSGAIAYWDGASGSGSSGQLGVAGPWQIIAVTKVAGTVAPRAHLYRFDLGTWSHGVCPAACVARTATPTYIFGGIVGQDFIGSMALGAATSTAFADATIDALITYQAISNAGFQEVWRLDRVGLPFNGSGSSTQTAIAGTKHTADEPRGFWGTSKHDFLRYPKPSLRRA
jgi:hypothetical protein